MSTKDIDAGQQPAPLAGVGSSEGLGAWLPIETAPRSALAGQILTFRNYGGLEASFHAKRGQHGPWFQTSFWSEKYSLWVGWPLNVQPTHWMPLPAPPVSA